MPERAGARDQEALHPDLQTLLDDLETQTAEVEGLLGELGPEQLNWRPAPDRWSVGEHLDHLVATNRLYLKSLSRAVERGRAEGKTGPGPYRHPLLARLLLWSMGPPVRLKVKAVEALEPGEGHDAAELLGSFRSTQDEVAVTLRDADGLDLGAIRFPSAIASWVRLSLGTAFGILVAHNDRHLWHARRVLEEEAFPGA